MRINGWVAVLLTLASALPAAAREWDRETPLEVTADRIDYQRRHDLYTADGRVRVVQGGRSIDAEWLVFSNETGRGVAVGDVVLRDGSEVLEADLLEFELETLQGQVFDGELDTGEGGFRVSARELVKTADRRYSIVKGTFTTCRCPEGDRVPWKIRTSRARVELGGYAVARNASLEVLGIPVVWLPWMIYPVKSERESGLLFPLFGVGSRNGFEFGLPIFWAAHDQLNVVLTPSYLTQRGFKPELELQYVFGERSAGGLFGSWVDDEEWDPSTKENPFVRQRWGVAWEHDHFLPAGWRLKSDVELVSDNNYVDDFPNDLEEHRRDRFLESRIFAFNHFGESGWLGASAGVAYADDLQSPDDEDRDKFLLQRLPEVEVEGLPEVLGRTGIAASFDTEYAHFQALEPASDSFPRAVRTAASVTTPAMTVVPRGHLPSPNGRFLDVGFDAQSNYVENDRRVLGTPFPFRDRNLDDFGVGGPDGDGLFQAGEPLTDRGHRLIVHPRFAYPLRVADRIELLPEVGYQETLYWTDAQDFEERGLITGRLDAKTRLVRTLDLPWGMPDTRHVLEPRLGWALTSQRKQRRNPLFVPGTAVPQRRIRQLALDSYVRDHADRIDSANVVVLGLGNRFYAKRKGRRRESLRAELEVSADYDFGGDGFGRIVLEGATLPRTGVRSRFNLSFDPDRSRVDEGRLDVHYRFPNFSTVGVGYRYLRRIPVFFESFRSDPDRFQQFQRGKRINQIDLHTRIQLGDRWALIYTGSYSFETRDLLTNRGGIEYVSKCRCWAIGLDVEGDRSRGLQFRPRFTLLGLGDDPRRPFAGGRGLSSMRLGR